MLRKMIMTIGLTLALALPVLAEVSNEHIQELLARAHDGDIAAAGTLGGMYFYGREGLEQDDEQAFKWLERTLENERSPSMLLGLMYYQGRYVARDYDKAYEIFNLAAGRGFAAKNLINELYHNGKPVRYIDNLIAKAEAGDAERQYELAMLYLSSWEVKRDLSACIEWMERAAGQGHREAQLFLGTAYMGWMGFDGDPDFTNAERGLYWLTEAAEQGDISAMGTLAGLYLGEPELITPDLEEARKWLVKAADTGSPDVAYHMGEFYEKGEYFDKDLNEAVCWYRKAAEQDHAGAMLALARMYRTGAGVQRDEIKAAEWQLKAAPYMEQMAGRILADYNLYGHNTSSGGNMTVFYTGTYEDMVKSWQEASRGLKGFPNMALLTDIYTYGLSVNKDVGVAVKMHEKLARAGDLSSQKFLYRYYGPWAANYGAEPDAAAAREWYEMAAAQNDVAALYELGKMYLEGRDVAVDYVKAYVYTARAYAATDYMWPMRNKYRAVLEQDITPAMTEAQLREARKLLEQAGLESESYL